MLGKKKKKSQLITVRMAARHKVTYEPRMRTWDWRLFTWLSLLWRNCGREKFTVTFARKPRRPRTPHSRHANALYLHSHLWHPSLPWCSALELKARLWWTRRGRRSEVLTKTQRRTSVKRGFFFLNTGFQAGVSHVKVMDLTLNAKLTWRMSRNRK